MCGIFGCISADAAAMVLDGLRKLEYRGYDSAGLAAIFPDHSGPIQTERATGYVSELASKANGRFDGAHISIGHTRWATHGGVTESNAHPHSSNDGNISIVHNGIIENASELSERVKNLGYEIESETDSEIIVHLLHHELHIQPESSSELDAFQSVIGLLSGSWAIAAIISGTSEILLARKGSPLIIGKGLNHSCITSDIQPLYGLCSEIAFVEEGGILSVSLSAIKSTDNYQSPEFIELEGKYEGEDSGFFPHLMLKEIHDQPVSLSNSLSGRISPDGKKAILGGMALSPNEIRSLDRINIVACGSAFFASQIGCKFLMSYSDVTVEAFLATDFPAMTVCGENTLTIAVSQSGETKDTFDALKMAKKYGGHISSFCNVVGSTIARFTGNGAYLHSGPEYAVASTKVFTSMIAVFSILAMSLSEIPSRKREELISGLRTLPSLVSRQIIEEDGTIDQAVAILSEASFSIFIGRGISASIASEGALKMMEIAYLPCLSYPAGELKHGPMALIEDGTPIIAIAPDDSTFKKTLSNIRECQARGAKIILISDSESPECNIADVFIPTPKGNPLSSPIINSIPMQLLAYRLAASKGTNIDRPRNLAKSVTVS